MDPRTYREIEHLCAEIAQLQARLAQLLAQEQDFSPEGPFLIQRGIEQIAHEVRRRADQVVYLALARINLRDERYQFLRAIDGDTIEVYPPGELREWMRDVHIRLYGIDAPEHGQQRAAFYTELLQSLCSIDNGALSIVWERERRGNEYGGFPLASFERGIGNVFVDIPDTNDRVLYVNAFLASFPDVRLVRNEKSLLRGARIFQTLEVEWPHFFWHRRGWPYSHRFWKFPRMPFDISRPVPHLQDFARSLGRNCPSCVPWVLPRSAIANPESRLLAVTEQFAGSLRECGCLRCRRLEKFLEAELPEHLEREQASVYDILLLLARGPYT